MSKQTRGRNGVATNDLEVSLAPLLTMFLIGTTGMTICHKLAIAAVKLPLLLVAFQTFISLVISGAFWPMVRLGGISDLLKYLMVSLCYMGTLICSMIAYFYCSLCKMTIKFTITTLLFPFFSTAHFPFQSRHVQNIQIEI